MAKYSDKDYWRMLTLYGLNTSTYKIALAECLSDFTKEDLTNISWDALSEKFFDIYHQRLQNDMPQLNHDTRQTVMERVIKRYNAGTIDKGEAIEFVKNNAFNDVIPRFHNLNNDKIDNEFYVVDKDKGLILTDSLFNVFNDEESGSLNDELDARWSLLESAFAMKRDNASLLNDIKEFYLIRGYERTSITYMKNMLNGYQEGRCFYCGEKLDPNNIHVDHVIPRTYIYHDEPWNLVLSHDFCNESKSDFLPSEYYVQKLVDRNERLISSNHPLSKKIIEALGGTATTRKKNVFKVYNELLNALGSVNVWGGSPDFNPEKDPFYKTLIKEMLKQ